MNEYVRNRKRTYSIEDKQCYEALLNPLLHNNLEQMRIVQNTKVKILNNIRRVSDNKQLICDPSELGRYMNFRGASSTIANYIKSLGASVRGKFLTPDIPQRLNGYKSPRRQYRKLENQLQTMIKPQIFETIQVQPPKQQLDKRSKSHRSTDARVIVEQISVDRIHAQTPGRILQPSYKPLFRTIKFDDSRTILPLQTILRSQVLDILDKRYDK